MLFKKQLTHIKNFIEDILDDRLDHILNRHYMMHEEILAEISNRLSELEKVPPVNDYKVTLKQKHTGKTVAVIYVQANGPEPWLSAAADTEAGKSDYYIEVESCEG